MGCAYLGIADLIATYGLTAVVETGTGWGGSLFAVKDLPVVYFGCDTDEAAVRHCKAEVPHAVLALKDSCQFLRELLTARATAEGAVVEPFAMPTLFWLDAHGFEGPRGFPLLEEMETIAALKPGIERDVILCDDLRVIADEANPRYRRDELGPPYVRDEYPFEAYTNVFAKTHRTRIWLEDEGVMGFLPNLTAAQRG